MKKLKLEVPILFFMLAYSFCTYSQDLDYKGFPEWSKHTQGITEYYLYTPNNIVQGEKVPIALFLHGCCGTSYTANLRNAVDPPVRMWHNFGDNEQTVPVYIIAPATSSGWNQHFSNLKAVMDDLVANHQGDPQRIYITGFSMGGGGTWDFISTYPNYFAAAIPMAMDFRGNKSTSKDIPIWAHRGEYDTYPANLDIAISDMRLLNGDPRGNQEWDFGVNPILTTYPGEGHGVQWTAASTNDLVSWALTKINDGNIYPNVYFKTPTQSQIVESDELAIDIWAKDNDGSIAKIEVILNGSLVKTFNTEPYTDILKIRKGNNKLEAIAYDNLGKTSRTELRISLPDFPRILTAGLPEGQVGSSYYKKIYVDALGGITYKLEQGKSLPIGLSLSKEGIISGIPVQMGIYPLRFIISDSLNNSVYVDYTINIKEKDPNEVIITNINRIAQIKKARNGVSPEYNLSFLQSINFSI